jgi:hypothetical protein
MEKVEAAMMADACVLRGVNMNDEIRAQGRYEVKCYDENGNLKWDEVIDNVVTDVGARLMLDTFLGGAANSTYFLGLISSVGYVSVPVAADTMSSHATWVEAGNASNYPLWTTPASNARATITWSAASARSKALASAASFTIGATGGTIKGCFIVTGPGAVATNASTAGTLYSAGLFTGGDKIVSTGDTVQCSYTTSV